MPKKLEERKTKKHPEFPKLVTKKGRLVTKKGALVTKKKTVVK